MVLPLLEHPSEAFLALLEEDLTKLIVQQDVAVVSSCLSCLATIVNKITKNYKLIVDCYVKFRGECWCVSQLFWEQKKRIGL